MGNARTYHGCTQLAILAMGVGALPAVDGECGCLHDLLLRTDGEAALDLLPVTVAGPHAGCAMQRTRCTHAMCMCMCTPCCPCMRMRRAHLVLDRDHAVAAAVRERVDRPAEELVRHVHAQAAALHDEAHLVALTVDEQYLGRWCRPLALSLERLWDVRLVQHMHGG